MTNVNSNELARRLQFAGGIKGNPLPKAVIQHMLVLKENNPELEISFGGERNMDFFRSQRAEHFVFLDRNAHHFEFAENPTARSLDFFAFEQKGNEVILFARFR